MNIVSSCLFLKLKNMGDIRVVGLPNLVNLKYFNFLLTFARSRMASNTILFEINNLPIYNIFFCKYNEFYC